MQKKGAIELSMSTIIVVIIGVVLLILGLTFVRGIFSKTDVLTGNAFDEAETAMKNIGTPTEELTVAPLKTSMSQGETKGALVVIYNIDTKEHKYNLKTSLPSKTATAGKISCVMAETQEESSNTITVESGRQRRDIKVLITDGGSPLGTYICNVNLYRDGSTETRDTRSITVEIK